LVATARGRRAHARRPQGDPRHGLDAPGLKSLTVPKNCLQLVARLPTALANRDGEITGGVDRDHLGLGSGAADIASLLFDSQRLRLARERLNRRIVEIAGEDGLRCTVDYTALARLALMAQPGEHDQFETLRRSATPPRTRPLTRGRWRLPPFVVVEPGVGERVAAVGVVV
jgi:hypothetical protein